MIVLSDDCEVRGKLCTFVKLHDVKATNPNNSLERFLGHVV